MTAADVLRASIGTYASTARYTDRGHHETKFKTDHPFTTVIDFETAFIRNDRFRFSYREQMGGRTTAMTIWSNGQHTYVDWSVGPSMKDHGTNLSLALAGATGVSGGTAHVVPRLLMPSEVDGASLMALDNAELLGSEAVDAHACWHLRGRQRGETYELWIDTASYLLRRYSHSHHFDDGHRAFDTEETTTYDPIANGTVAESQLQSPYTSKPLVAPKQPSWIGVRFDPNSTRIVGVVHGAPGDQAGLQAGDEIVSIDGRATKTPSDVISHVSIADKPLALVVRRAGKDVPITVTPTARPEHSPLSAQTLVGKPAPEFTVAIVSGSGPASLADVKGKATLIEFWATWCGPCKPMAAHLDLWHARYPQLQIVGVSDEDVDDIKGFATASKHTYALARDADDAMTMAYQVGGLPTVLVIDKQGVVRYVTVGAGDFDGVEAAIKNALK